MKSSAFFLKSVYKLGIENIFGIVGGEAQAIQFDAEENINFYLTRHEFAAGIMADTYSRITGKPQMCYSTFGPGLSNLTTSVFSAIQDRSPMLVVSAQLQRAEICYNQTHQCLDSVSFMKPITKFAAEITNTREIPNLLTEALTIAVNGMPGPVYLSYPWDLMKEEIDDDEAYRLLDQLKPIEVSLPPVPDHKQLDIIVEKIKAAKHPLIVVGNQVIRENCCSEFVQFATDTNIPVMVTLSSKGVISDTHPLSITTICKYIDKVYRQPIADKIFEECDLMLLFGYDFGEDVKPSLWKNKIETIVINSYYNDMGKIFQPNMLYLGDMKKSLNYLSAAKISPKIIPNNVIEAKQLFENIVVKDDGETEVLASIMTSIRNSLGENGILCVDVGLHKLYAALFSKTYKPNTFISSNVCGTFGFSLPAALGVKLAKPLERVCVVCGDGGFHSTSHDLETAIRHNIPIVVVVLNDNAFGMIKYFQLLARDEIFARTVEFGKIDFVKLANANGVEGKLITDNTELEAVMNKAFESNTSFLIEIPTKYCYKL
jgi:N2-(2-carboxyethyl)arginine synthase